MYIAAKTKCSELLDLSASVGMSLEENEKILPRKVA